MARKLRLEYPGAIYHVINRGNRRVGPFGAARTRDAFEECLFAACLRSQWVLHAYVVMSNHFHLAVETPAGNLATGMQWLQATFTNRYNRVRGQAGHGSIFQGRYKALVVERGAPLGMVCDYIHLNPVRAGIVPLGSLAEWRWSSYRWLRAKGERPAWLHAATALTAAGGLADDPAGWAAYDRFLAWQAEEGPAGNGPAYVSLSQGWALGTEGFRAALVKDHDLTATARAWEVGGADEVRNMRCEERLQACLRAMGKEQKNVMDDIKGAAWKVAVAAWMKQATDASNGWLAERLRMGSATRVSQVVGAVTRQPTSPAAECLKVLSEILAT
jgi:REP element-mobilizing transposase RayT